MNEHEQWLQKNDDYLLDAISWLHLRLEQLCPEPEPVSDNKKTCWFKRVCAKPLPKKIRPIKLKSLRNLLKK